jgi:hypothetical protein
MISYCIACYRPVYSEQLIRELIRKTSAPYEILLWINVADAEFEQFLADEIVLGAPIRIIGRTRENIGMAAYPRLFSMSRFEMVVQIDDDVVCVSPLIAERARETFDRFSRVGMLTADVWQDDFTNGARPPMQAYREISRDFGLFDGPIDGWFAIYRKDSLLRCRDLNPGRYYCLGCAVKQRLGSFGQSGLLCTRIKVFHVTDPQYASFFGMLEFEIAKYAELGSQALVECYKTQGVPSGVPSREELAQRVDRIRTSFECLP